MLSFDLCRCHDHHCPQSKTCKRYLYRNDDYDYLTHCMSLMDAATKTCDYYIKDLSEKEKHGTEAEASPAST
jgi:hypothetical protein